MNIKLLHLLQHLTEPQHVSTKYLKYKIVIFYKINYK